MSDPSATPRSICHQQAGRGHVTPRLRPAGLRFVGLRFGGLFLMGLWSAGCGPDVGFPVAPVTGTVTYQHQPLAGGTVVFHPTGTTPGPQAMGKIEPDGTFRLRVAGVDGAAVGDHVVTVDYRRELTEQESRNLVIPELLIPRQYAQLSASPLRFSVAPDQPNNCSIVLED